MTALIRHEVYHPSDCTRPSVGATQRLFGLFALAEPVAHAVKSLADCPPLFPIFSWKLATPSAITKDELLKWMLDVKLEFISDRDFNALWSAMDIDNTGEVNAIDFFVFLSACGSEFEQVYREQKAMPKQERLKLAARRLSNINKMGENGVRALEHRLERTRGSAGSK